MMLDSDGLVEGSASIACILADESSDSAASDSNTDWFFCKLLVLIISFYVFVFVLSFHYFSSAVLLNKIKL